MLSIIIITKNEEVYLPRLLKTIEKQTFKDFEIILSDADSTDNTREIAKKYGCKIIDGGLPSKGRNNGAKKAKFDLLLFLDADVLLHKDFLKKNVNEFNEKKLDIAGVYSEPIEKSFISNLYISIMNFVQKISQKVYPLMPGYCLFVKKKPFDKVNGFDEKIIFNEDTDLIQRIAKTSKFRMLKSKKIKMSMRRFKVVGYFKMALIYIWYHLLRLFRVKYLNVKWYFDINYRR